MSVAFSVDIRKLVIAAGVRETIYGVGNTFTVLTADVAGNTDPDFRIGLGDQSPVRFARGLRYRMPDGEQFSGLTIENPAGAAGPLNISIMIAQGDVSDERAQLVGTVNANILSMPAVTIAAGQTLNIGTMPAVAISGTPTVGIAAGQTLNIGTMPAVAISGTPTVAVASPPTGASVVTESNFSADTIQRVCLPASTSRLSVMIQNMGPATVRVGMFVTAGSGIRLRPGQALTMDIAGEIRCICDSGTATLMRQWVSK
ncbi:hypothetical protein [Asticcacaulis sp.]|uniref:hypothetical protein n=1 Tax=Asticcacaulis sp. TaxID=1872648 RepID=UPI002610E106|nr:hypothetical protein [Asticcacaulis sp.]